MQDLTKGRPGFITHSETDNRVLYGARLCLGPLCPEGGSVVTPSKRLGIPTQAL